MCLMAVFILAYAEVLPDHRVTGALCSIVLAGLIVVSPLIAGWVLGRSESTLVCSGRRCLIGVGYLLLVIAVFPRMGAAYYTAYNLRYEEGTFTTYIATKYGRRGTANVKQDDGGEIKCDYIKYAKLQKQHGTMTWNAPDGHLLREEQWTFGVRHGSVTLYHLEAGRVYVSGQYRHGRKHGTWNVFTSEGNLFASGEFASGVPIDVTWSYFDREGRVESSGHYKGDQETFFASGLAGKVNNGE
jgi:hypothetical protein